MADTVRPGRDRRRAGRVRGGDPRRAARHEGRRASRSGANKALGGTCLNVGCIPSKALLDSSELYEVTLHKLARHGIKVGSVALDLPDDAQAQGRGRQGADRRRRLSCSRRTRSTAVLSARASCSSGDKVEVTAADGKKTLLEAKNVLLATGSESAELPFLKFDGKHIVSSTEALNFDTVPKHLIVVGGGYIGLELGSRLEAARREGDGARVPAADPADQRRRDRRRGARSCSPSRASSSTSTRR